MTKKAILLALSLLATARVSLAQETEKVVANNAVTHNREEYYVVKSNPIIRQGTYQQFEGPKGKKPILSGHFSNNQRDSTWTMYQPGGKKLLARGSYQNNQRAGVWEFYTPTGTLANKYDYTQNKLVFSAPDDSSKPLVFQPLPGQPALEIKPVYLQGTQALFMAVGQNVRYPPEALRAQLQGDIVIAFTIDSNGQTSNYHVVKGLGFGLDEAALQALQQLPDMWLPASANGQAVAATCEIPVSFRVTVTTTVR